VATGLGLGICAVAGFDDDDVDALLRIDGHDEFSCLLLGIGKPFSFPG
jgi:nitroreductase